MSVPSPDLSEERITRLLTTRRLGRPCVFFDQIGSTNDEARRRAEEGAHEGLLLVADEQTAGRGRLDRRWLAPPGSGLLMSLLLRPDLPAGRAGQLTMCFGLGAVEGIAEVTGLCPRLKWPNDLILSGRKLGGMLSEIQATDPHLAYVILGLGINVNLSFADLAPDAPQDLQAARRELSKSAISLSETLGRPLDRAVLLAAILQRSEDRYDQLLHDRFGGRSIVTAWANALETLGQDVLVITAAHSHQGRAVDVTLDGGLVLEDVSGHRHTVWSGDVTSLRRVL